jgi:hypothetical protein
VFYADVAELADAHDSKSCGVAPRVGSTPTIGIENREKPLGTRGFTYVKSLVFLFTEYDSRRKNRVRTIVFGKVKWKVGRMENERREFFKNSYVFTLVLTVKITI